ncbi:ABC transporter substrate-binding protein [Geobacter sp.]|uniref:ABC transporter substrate-binding protein n=1 Tax=Geobacter sp. TaxID=46610 RepID=UPI002610835A|nr:ABC transporter substrate-binding protein [Geobacter sp.]
MKSRISATLAVVAMVLMFLATVPISHAKEFLVGVEAPLTGALARVGRGTNEGIMVATEVFNRHNPKHKIKLVTIDNESSPAKAVAAVERLASQGVVGITGGYGSNIIGPASDAAEKAGIVYITSGGTGKELTARGLKHFFRITNTEGYNKVAKGLFANWGVRSVSIIYNTKEGTVDLAKDSQRDLTARGIKVAMHPFDPGISDFKPIVNKVKLQDRSEVIFMIGYENDYVGILRAAKVLRPQVKAMVGAWSLATPKMATDFPDLMPNVYGTALIPDPPEFKTAEGKEFFQTQQRMFRKDLDYLNLLGYVQAMLLFEAIKRADEKGTLAKGGVADELRKTNKETLIGRVTFDHKGDNITFAQRMGQHQAGGKIPLVWPKEYANARMNYPAVPW